MQLTPNENQNLQLCVRQALSEDIGQGDISAALIAESQTLTTTLVVREQAILCGKPWVEEVYNQLGQNVSIEWLFQEGEAMPPESQVATLHGPARALLTGERTALNFLQTLSGTASSTAHYVSLLAPYKAKLLDTRKTIPGLRLAQKYAVRVAGGHNHRLGLYDAYLIKENHIAACGGITTAVSQARELAPGSPLEVEVENLRELEEALACDVERVLLDNFPLDLLLQAVEFNKGRAELEASGNITPETLVAIARTGVDYISSGAVTKHLRAVDYSLRYT